MMLGVVGIVPKPSAGSNLRRPDILKPKGEQTKDNLTKHKMVSVVLFLVYSSNSGFRIQKREK